MIRVFRSLALAATLVAATAMAPVSSAAQGRPVVGTYNALINTPQGPVKAVIVIKRENGAYAGTVAAEGFPVLPISQVTPNDAGLVVAADTPDGGVVVTMKYGAGDKMTGTVAYSGMDMPFDGTYAPAGAAPAANGFSGVGVYAVKTTDPLMGAAGFEVTCIVTKTPAGALSGTCGNPAAGEVPAASISVSGNVVTMSGPTPAGEFKLAMTVVNGVVDGTIVLGAELAKLKGTHTAK